MRGSPGDRTIARLAPDALLVLDAAACIVLVTPARRVTISNVAAWREGLAQAKIAQDVYTAESEQARRDHAAGRLAAIARVRRGTPVDGLYTADGIAAVVDHVVDDGAAAVVDGNSDDAVDVMLAAGYELVPGVHIVGGKRIRYLSWPGPGLGPAPHLPPEASDRD